MGPYQIDGEMRDPAGNRDSYQRFFGRHVEEEANFDDAFANLPLRSKVKVSSSRFRTIRISC